MHALSAPGVRFGLPWEQISAANGGGSLYPGRQLIIPGVVAPLKEELAAYTGWDIRVGPICVAELPLFLGEADWQPPDGS